MNAIICDLDGTLCDVDHRRHFVMGEKKDWRSFYESMVTDTLRIDVHEQVEGQIEKHAAKLILVSARPETYREKTVAWLAEHGIVYDALYMRPEGDSRPDTEIKSEIHDNHLNIYDIKAVFDDRPKVIRMWREKGLNVIDVGDGVEF